MTVIGKFMSDRYRECLNHPIYILVMVLAVIVFFGQYLSDFRFDASEETLMPDGDSDLAFYSEIVSELGDSEFIFLTYAPSGYDLFDRMALNDLNDLTQRLSQVAGVAGVYSILDAPLLESPPIPISELARHIPTLRDDDVDLAMARSELIQSPLFSELLISRNGQTTALRIDLESDAGLDESQILIAQALRKQTLVDIRTIRDSLPASVTAYLGGVPLVAADMVRFIKADVLSFGTAVLLLVAVMLFFIFRQLRWVFVPLISTAVTLFITIGILGFLDHPATVISSNFISLLSIITISFSIHLISRYREIRAEEPDATQTDLVYRALADKFVPCVYTALTTMVAFGSLITSDIRPVTDFGRIMCLGIAVSFIVTYSIFAALLLLLSKGQASATLHHEPVITRFLATLSMDRSFLIVLLAIFSSLVAGLGISRISMDNRFIEYFRSDTEIFKGLRHIDKNLGGTIPFDVILQFDPYVQIEMDDSSPFLDDSEPDPYPERYWYAPDKIAVLAQIESYLAQRPEVGKTLSLATLEQIGRTFNSGQPLGSVEMAAALGAMPDDIRRELVSPYASPDKGFMRLSARLHETGLAYSHDSLMADIRQYAINEVGISPENIRITGMAVFFNNMLNELYSSQRSTILFVIAATFFMFLMLLRSLTFAILGLIPNILAAMTILAFMGFTGIPLDIMSITIAAIIIGIGVDDAIHYLYRFKQEFATGMDVREAVRKSHATIGDAIYYTSFTVIIGFSVLGFSNFMPTVYFGLLAALAMILALLANLTVLPSLLILVYGRKRPR